MVTLSGTWRPPTMALCLSHGSAMTVLRRCCSMPGLLGLAITLCASTVLATDVPRQQAPEPELKPALSASVKFSSIQGADLPLIAPQSPFAIEVKITNLIGSDAPAGLQLFGWLRRHDESNLTCTESAESFLRTGRLPLGAVFLNDPVIGAVTKDNALLLVDPEFSLATANLLAADTLSGTPAQIVPDNAARRFLLPLPSQGKLLAIGSGGTKTEIANNLGQPIAVVPGSNGDVIVLDAVSQRLIRISGRQVPEMQAHGLRGSAWSESAAIWSDEGAIAFNTSDGRVLLDVPGAADSAAVLSDVAHPFALAVLLNDQLRIHYFDAPGDSATSITLAAPATELAVSPHGRFVFAHDPLGGPVSVIDVGRSRMVQASKAKGVPVSEIVVTDEAAYLMLADQSRVGVLDFVSLASGTEAEFREVPLGKPRDELLTSPGLLAPLWPQPGVLAVHAQSQQGYRVAEASSMGNAPPMTFTPIRGGVPKQVAVLDRSFLEEPRGSFRTVASLPGSGEWELVATTGIGSLSFCATLPVSDPGEPEKVPGSIDAVKQSDGRSIRLKLTDSKGSTVATTGVLTFSALSGRWRDSLLMQTDTDGLTIDIYELPDAGPVGVTLNTQDGNHWLPIVLEELN